MGSKKIYHTGQLSPRQKTIDVNFALNTAKGTLPSRNSDPSQWPARDRPISGPASGRARARRERAGAGSARRGGLQARLPSWGVDRSREAGTGVSGLGEKVSGLGKPASQTLGHQPAGRASSRACGPQGGRGEDLGESRNHPPAVVESGSAVRPCESALDPAGRSRVADAGEAQRLRRRARAPRAFLRLCPGPCDLQLRSALSPPLIFLFCLSFLASLTLPCSQLPAEFASGHKKRALAFTREAGWAGRVCFINREIVWG
ncbi:uncharacterized protein LOC122475929 [Prionailurus bengalensis]|uniref:uncharacterized protein LOC122475929 n=1 Tax=Prionailurus bengalensis TaxID=37029 RepID=UPI001CA83C84|nr:uncharacterized protein LOC122475929 [Prionailurus bengalensis]